MQHRDIDEIAHYVSLNLEAEWEDPESTVLRVARKSGGVFLWAELVVGILNAAILEGATQALIDNMILEMPGYLDGLYEWMLSTLTEEEKVETLALFQWAILGSEPMRLDDLVTAVRVTASWTTDEMQPENALAVDPPMSFRSLGDLGATSLRDCKGWLNVASLGLLEVRTEPDDVESEELGLQRVHVIDESVRTFFLSGRGFAALDKNNETTFYSHSWSEHDLGDVSHYVLLNACINFLNMTDFDFLGRELSRATTRANIAYWRAKQHEQRRLIISSYPFLQYAVDNLLYHMLSPRQFRYYLPQKDILNLFAANNCRLWRRWTFLIGVRINEPEAALAVSTEGPAGPLLDPVYGARFRLERVFRRVSKMAEIEHRVSFKIQDEGELKGGLEHGKLSLGNLKQDDNNSLQRQHPTFVGLPRALSEPVPRKLKSCLKVDIRPKPLEVTVATPTSPGSSSYSRHDRIVSYTSTDVPSIFSPVDIGSPKSVHSLMSPLSVLEATFEAAAKGRDIYDSV
ncbi:uncharacterized protein PgNI_09103 [Pyricularia grisea]|uniref:Uncharacterized protein n=1 Tax=Pyricularia grisea TaxID=148305 RepID=A0A6P8ATA9_PYRGI|nr:uncharacterized protein PgNI_09103 [Pyricularia grisea]TLD05350.1 hypothetical protein PgNI_09103 [Pyricularia grisea]